MNVSIEKKRTLPRQDNVQTREMGRFLFFRDCHLSYKTAVAVKQTLGSLLEKMFSELFPHSFQFAPLVLIAPLKLEKQF